jgi:hypothetical protein
MKIYDIDNLKKINGGYDLFTRTYKYVFSGIRYLEYRIQKGEEMRIDLVCQSIYGNIDYIDILLNANNISNPLNIKEGTLIRYPNQSDIEVLRFKEKKSKEESKVLSNPNKSTKVDSSRQKFVEVGGISSPNIVQLPDNQVSTKGGLLRVGNNLFNK